MLGLLLVGALTSCINGRSVAKPELTIAVERITSLDPLALREPGAMLIDRALFDTIVRFDEDAQLLKPSLAESWETLDSGSRFIFHIDPRAKFHDGAKVRSEDVKFSLDRLASASTHSDSAPLLADILGFDDVSVRGVQGLSGVSVIDESSFEIRLASPWREFPLVLTNLATAPVAKTQVERNPDGLRTSPIGTGPYRLIRSAQGRIDLRRNVHYFGTAPLTDRVSFVSYPNDRAALADLEDGKVDLARAPARSAANAIARFGSAGVVPLSAGIYIGVDVQKVALDTRRRIARSIDRETLSKQALGYAAQPAVSLTLPPGTAKCEECRFDPLAQTNQLSIKIGYPASGSLSEIGDAVADALDAAGIHTERVKSDVATVLAGVDAGDIDAYVFGWSGEYPGPHAFLYPLVRTGSSNNHTHYSVTAVDALIEQFRASPDRVGATEAITAAESRVLADLAVIPLI
ncbi:MAG TPA: ABC transporter substrate-binding protein, partial [Actinomycetota bacterium]|nr:ABC transporter substrate-binding protein [Actinomycetota bacterium]